MSVLYTMYKYVQNQSDIQNCCKCKTTPTTPVRSSRGPVIQTSRGGTVVGEAMLRGEECTRPDPGVDSLSSFGPIRPGCKTAGPALCANLCIRVRCARVAPPRGHRSIPARGCGFANGSYPPSGCAQAQSEPQCAPWNLPPPAT